MACGPDAAQPPRGGGDDDDLTVKASSVKVSDVTTWARRSRQRVRSFYRWALRHNKSSALALEALDDALVQLLYTLGQSLNETDRKRARDQLRRRRAASAGDQPAPPPSST